MDYLNHYNQNADAAVAESQLEYTPNTVNLGSFKIPRSQNIVH